MTFQKAFEWRVLLDREAEARKAARDGAGRPDSAERMRNWWAIVSKVLKEYSKAVARRSIPDPPPAELADVLAGLAGYLAVGQVPWPISITAKEGRRSHGPMEQRDIGTAVVYWLACRPEGIEHNGSMVRIDDPDPVERLHFWYGVSKRTVYDWLKRHPPAFLGVNDVNADVIIHLTTSAAERYRQAGRSHAAIARRGKKPVPGVRTTR